MLSIYSEPPRLMIFMFHNFRHGAWLSMGNVDLHLIKGRPAVHEDDDLIVGHIAVTVDNDRIEELQKRLQEMGIQYRTNVSVPNPVIGQPTKQVKIY